MPSDWKGAFSRMLQRQRSERGKRLANLRWTKDRERRNRLAELEAQHNPTRIVARIVVIVNEQKAKEFTMWSFESWRERRKKCRKAEHFALDHSMHPAHKGTMNTIKCLVVLGILMVTAVMARCAEAAIAVAPEKEGYYKAGEFQIEGFYQTVTEDFEKERGGTGIGVGYYLTENFGARVQSVVNNLNGLFVDNVSLHALYRIPIKQSAIYGYGGSTFLIKPEEFSVDLGVGVEHRFRPNWGPFLEAGMIKLIDHGAEAVGRVGLRVSF